MEEIKDITSLGVKFVSAKLDGIQFNEIQKVGTQLTYEFYKPYGKEQPWKH